MGSCTGSRNGTNVGSYTGSGNVTNVVSCTGIGDGEKCGELYRKWDDTESGELPEVGFTESGKM